MTIGLKSVENPLEFGIVVTDDDGRIERFLEKPSWGQVFSDTINTGIYVLEPEVLRHIPKDRPFDFSKELFPLLLEMGRPMYGYVMDGYWQDIGNLDQFRQANFDALDEKVRLNMPGIRIRGNVWVGEGVDLHDLDALEGPAFLGNYCRVATGRDGRPVHRARLERDAARARADVALDHRRVDVDRPLDDGRGRDRRALVRPPRARARAGGRRDRRRGDDRLRERDHARRPDLPVQGGRDRLAALREPHLGVARDDAHLPGERRLRPRQRRPHAGRRRASSPPRSAPR